MLEWILADGDEGEQQAIERHRSRLRAAFIETNDDRVNVLSWLSVRYRTSPRLTPLRTIAFWAAIVLPFIYLPLLFTGLSSRPTFEVFVVLLTLNFIALVAGFSHQP